MGDDVVDDMSWDDFSNRFRAEFSPAIEVQQLVREFLDLRQTTETVAEIIVKLQERALLVPQYAADEGMKKMGCHDMLQDDIREFVSILGCETLNDIISRTREKDIDLEHVRKRGSDQVQTLESPGKRPKTSY